jgi:hypothetical protein
MANFSTSFVPSPEDWRELYRAAILEVNLEQLPQRISEARVAIMGRIEATLVTPGSREHQEMYDALSGLRVLCKEFEWQARQNLQANLEKLIENGDREDLPKRKAS